MNIMTFTPSLFVQHEICPHWIWYDLYGNPQERQETPEMTQRLMDKGRMHEQNCVAGLDFMKVDLDLPPQIAFAETVRLMRQGIPWIYQGFLQTSNYDMQYYGRPDLLQKIPGSSWFGNFFYAPIEIKCSKEIKRSHWMQLTLYAQMLEAIQGVFPTVVAIINSNSQRINFQIENQHREETTNKTNEIIHIMRGHKPSLQLTSSCKNSPWFSSCVKAAEQAQDIALVYRLTTKAINYLRKNNIHTLSDLANANIGMLPSTSVISDENLHRAQTQAKSLLYKQVFWIKKQSIPDAPIRIYFDIEGDPFLGVEYLFGLLIEENGKPSYYQYFLAQTPAQEQQMWQQFSLWLESWSHSSSYKVYHYHHYEKTQVKKLTEKYGNSPTIHKFLGNFVDLATILRKSAILPLYFYSLKDIAKLPEVNYQWQNPKAGGAQSIFWYETWLYSGNQKILEDIIQYNKDDVYALEKLFKWMKSQ